MAQLETTYTLVLSESEAMSLKKLLGNIPEVDKKKFGLDQEGCRQTSEIWSLLPFEDEG